MALGDSSKSMALRRSEGNGRSITARKQLAATMLSLRHGFRDGADHWFQNENGGRAKRLESRTKSIRKRATRDWKRVRPTRSATAN